MRIQHPAFTSLPGIEHGFFTRNGGTSKNTYHSLNCGYGSDDSPEQITRNRALVAKTLKVKPDHLITVHQIHSAIAVIAEAPLDRTDLPKADAVVTNRPGMAVAILTADCGPILFADPKAGVVAAAHAGWRGAFGGILEATVKAMEQIGAKRESITAILGPVISGPNYEVDLPFKEQFCARNEEWDRFFGPGQREGHVQFDLPAFIMTQLQACDIQKAINLDRCTYGEEEHFFSYRRATHRSEPDYGRQISAIALRPQEI